MTALSEIPTPSQVSSILIVEDDLDLNNQLYSLLVSRGYQVAQSFEGDQALTTATKQHFDLILLDVLLPKINGFEFLSALRKTDQTPVIMLTACGAEEERITGYRRGADDYVPKPFSFTELLLRVEALLRRTQKTSKQHNAPLEICVDDLTLNRQIMTAYFQGEAVSLTPIQFRLLWVLVLQQGTTLTKPYLYQEVLEKDFSRYDRSLDMHLSRVRRKLTEAGMSGDRLKTVHGKGYRFQ